MKKYVSKKFLVISFSVLSIMFFTTSFSDKKVAAYSTCEWFANTSTISSATFEDDASQFNNANNIAQGTSWFSTLIYVQPTINIQTVLGSNHPAGTIYVYKSGVLVKTHSVAANANVGFLDSFIFDGNTNCHFTVVW